MHNISWNVILFYSIPQCFLYVWLGFQLINIKPPLLKLLYVSIAFSPFVYVVRRFDLPYGIHTIILTAIVICLTYLILKMQIINCAIAVMIGLIIALALESILLPLVIGVTNNSFTKVINSDFYSIAFSLPQLLVLFLSNAYLHYKKIYLFSIK